MEKVSTTFSAQLFLGAGEKELFSSALIREKIAAAKDSLNLKKLMIWDTDPGKLTEEILLFCRDNSIETYLWHPVLADMNHIEVTPETMADIPFIKGLDNLSGMWDKIGSGEENFLFVDPEYEYFHERNFHNYVTAIRDFSFDGVFLDRIRYSSPANGFESLFSTYLTSWLVQCEKEKRNPHDEKRRLESFYADMKGWDDKKLENYGSFEEILAPFSDFLQYKKERISRKVALYEKDARDKGKAFALDLLATSLSFFTGQDYGDLSTRCDWIKDMAYCYAMGPAALPLEILSLAKGFLKLAPLVSERAFLKFFERHSALVLPESLKQIEEEGVDPENAFRELNEALRQTEGRVPVYSGLEMVNTPYFSTKISEPMLNGYADALQGKCGGVVASWNILHIPDGHFRILGSRFL